MKKSISNLCGLAVLATSLAAFNVPQAFAKDSQKEIQSIYATYSRNLETGAKDSEAMSEAIVRLSEAQVTQDELVNFIAQDMNPQESKAFRLKVSKLSSSSESDREELMKELLSKEVNGSNFLGCGGGTILAAAGGGLTLLFAFATFGAYMEHKRATNGLNGNDPQRISDAKAALKSWTTVTAISASVAVVGVINDVVDCKRY